LALLSSLKKEELITWACALFTTKNPHPLQYHLLKRYINALAAAKAATASVF
jgi:hypothetical protein